MFPFIFCSWKNGPITSSLDKPLQTLTFGEPLYFSKISWGEPQEFEHCYNFQIHFVKLYLRHYIVIKKLKIVFHLIHKKVASSDFLFLLYVLIAWRI